MANANAEAQRRWRQRQKEKRQADLTKAPTGMADVFKTPFYQFRDRQEPHENGFSRSMRLAGVKDPPTFRINGNDGPNDGNKYDPHYRLNSSFRFAAETVGHLVAAAFDLAQDLNDYQRSEIKERLAALEISDLSEPEAKKAAMKEATRLNKMLDQLNTRVRWTFPRWKISESQFVADRPHLSGPRGMP